MNFSGKTAIVTGAASGMALLFCKKFADLGGNVVMTDINGDILTEKAAEINAENPGKALAAVCDVRKYEEVCAVRDLAVKTYGSIDVMVNLAGGAETRILHASGEFPDIPIEVYDWGIDVNLKGQFYFDHAVMKQMREQKSGVRLYNRRGGVRCKRCIFNLKKRRYERTYKIAGAVRLEVRYSLRLRISGTRSDTPRYGGYENRSRQGGRA